MLFVVYEILLCVPCQWYAFFHIHLHSVGDGVHLWPVWFECCNATHVTGVYVHILHSHAPYLPFYDNILMELFCRVLLRSYLSSEMKQTGNRRRRRRRRTNVSLFMHYMLISEVKIKLQTIKYNVNQLCTLSRKYLF